LFPPVSARASRKLPGPLSLASVTVSVFAGLASFVTKASAPPPFGLWPGLEVGTKSINPDNASKVKWEVNLVEFRLRLWLVVVVWEYLGLTWFSLGAESGRSERA